MLRRRAAGRRSVGFALVDIVALLSALIAISALRTPSGGPPPSNDVPSSIGNVGLVGSLGATVAIEPTPAAQLSSLAPATTAQPSSPASGTASPAARLSASSLSARHVWWIVLENHEYGAIIGNDQAPYLNGLAARYGLATNYYATGHPSEPNYVALVAGSTLGVASDGVYHLSGPSVFSQLQAAGRSWRVYAQDDPAGCFIGTAAGGGADGSGAPGVYARKHNPAISFTSVVGSASQCRNIQPLRAFDPAAGVFEMIVPNLTNDMHDGTIAQGDEFLRAFVPGIIASPAFRAGGVLFITFDEGSSNAGSLGDSGGHVATLIVASNMTPGRRDRTYADHWSLLRTTEDLLGLPCLANACRRTPMGS